MQQPQQMRAVDVTNLTKKQQEQFENEGGDAEIDASGILHPKTPKKYHRGTIPRYEPTKYQKRLIEIYQDENIIKRDGAINYKKMDVNHIIDKLKARKGKSVFRFLDEIGPSEVQRVKKALPSTHLQNKTVSKLERVIETHKKKTGSKKTSKNKKKTEKKPKRSKPEVVMDVPRE